MATLLRTRWTVPQIVSYLTSRSDDVRKVAALALGMVGTKCCIKAILPQLQHPDPMVNQMAEHALWSLWFRCGSDPANHELCRATKALNNRDFELALMHLGRAIELDPTFAEPYNQRAIVKYLTERYAESLEDCLRTIELMPCHFGAWAGLGHCYAHEGRLPEAIEAYDKALQINPHMESVRQLLTELRDQLDSGNASCCG